jgi:hypothetical protein
MGDTSTRPLVFFGFLVLSFWFRAQYYFFWKKGGRLQPFRILFGQKEWGDV